MKIAFIIYNFSESKGGVERYAYDLARYLAREDNQIHIFCHYLDAKTAENEPANVIFHQVPAAGPAAALKYLSFAANAEKMLRADRFDIIQHFGRTYYRDNKKSPYITKQVYRVGSGCHWEYLKEQHPSMSNIFGRLIQYLNPRNQIIMHLERKSFLASPDKKIIAISKKVKSEIQQYYNIPDHAIRIVYNGIDAARFNIGNREKYRKEARAKEGFTDDNIVLLFVGSGFERKGLRYAIEGLARLPEEKRANLKLLVVGNGSIPKYQSLAKKLGIENQVVFAGAQSNIEKYYAAADIFLFPTLFEPFGTVCLEAMASGLPVITTVIAGASEIITDAIDSFIIPKPSDTATIAEKILFLMDKVWRDNMGKAAALTASKYSFENNFRQVKEVYAEVLNS